MLHRMTKSRGREGYMAIKIDLEKPFDRVNWSLINITLEGIRLHLTIRDLIMRCIKFLFF